MAYEKGRVVRSIAGRDKDRFMAVTDCIQGVCLVCDGKERPLERPKRKNAKHLAATQCFLNEEQMMTNRALRKALRAFAEGAKRLEKEACTCPSRI